MNWLLVVVWVVWIRAEQVLDRRRVLESMVSCLMLALHFWPVVRTLVAAPPR